MHNKFFYSITGPTAVGKSDIAIRLAHKIDGEIINADMGQFYTPLTIGTAKPDWRHESVPHHLFDIFDTPKNCTVWEYRERIHAVMKDIWQRGRIPIIVGGSGFYIKSLFFPPLEQGHDVASTTHTYDEHDLWQQLHAIDPVRAQQIHKHDVYRIKRALDIWYKTGTKPSLLLPQYQPLGSFYCSIVTRDLQELYKRIDERVISMIEQGWIDEVMRLEHTDWVPFLHQKKIIGYDVILKFLELGKAHTHTNEMIALIQQKTRNYAKQQMTFFRSFDRQLSATIANLDAERILYDGVIEMSNLTLLDLNLYIEKLVNKEFSTTHK